MKDEFDKGALTPIDFGTIIVRKTPSFDWRVIKVSDNKTKTDFERHLKSLKSSAGWSTQENLWQFLFELFRCIQWKKAPLRTLFRSTDSLKAEASDFASYYFREVEETLFWDVQRMTYEQLVLKTKK